MPVGSGTPTVLPICGDMLDNRGVSSILLSQILATPLLDEHLKYTYTRKDVRPESCVHPSYYSLWCANALYGIVFLRHKIPHTSIRTS